MSTTSLFRSAAFRAALLCGALSACGGGGDAPAPVDPPAPPIVEPPAAQTVYLIHGNKVEICRSDATNVLVGCTDAGVSGFNGMTAMAVAGSHAFISTEDPSLIHCDIGANGILSDCATIDVEVVGSLYGLAVHKSNLYIAETSTPSIRKCEIRDDGSLGPCTDAGLPEALADTAEDIRFVDSTAYIAHYDEGLVSKCEVLADGSLSDCEDAGGTGFNGPEGLAISGPNLYVANSGGENVIRCLIDDGFLTDCVDAGVPAGLTYPTQVSIQGSTVYVTNYDEATVTRCTAATDGLLSGCTTISRGAGSLYSIVLK